MSSLASPPPPHPSMESVLFKLHQQLCTRALRSSSARTRNLLERTLLVLAVAGFGILLMAHWSFVHRGIPKTSSSYASSKSIPALCLASIPGFTREHVDVTHLSVWEDDDDEFEMRQHDQPQRSSVAFLETTSSPQEDTCFTIHNATRIVFSYSQVEGYLLLPTHIARERNLTIQHVVVAKHDVNCFGEPFLQQIVRLTGPDTVMINWILGLKSPHLGFVYNPRTNVMMDLQEYALPKYLHHHHHNPYYSSDYFLSSKQHSLLSYPYYSSRQHSHHTSKPPWHVQLTSKLAVVMKTCFLFFITTTLISFTLCETQERMLKFTHELQTQVRLRQAISSLVIGHLLENLVFVPQMIGLCFFLIEFYRGDKFLAFVILSLVWICEAFSVVSLRSQEGRHFFPRIFFLLFSLFHYYLFSFPFGFSYTALASTFLFLAHSMLFFWLRYELPAVAHGLVSLNQPRMVTTAPMTVATTTAPIIASSGPASFPSLPSNDNTTQQEQLQQQQQQQQQRNIANVRPPSTTLSPRDLLQPSVTIIRQGSNGTFASTAGNSRHTAASSSTTNHLFRRIGTDDDEDCDESYFFFMNGEVVMHRRTPTSAALRIEVTSPVALDGDHAHQQQPPPPSTTSTIGYDSPEQDAAHRVESTTSSVSLGDEGDSVASLSLPPTRTSTTPITAFVSSGPHTTRIAEAVEASALQFIIQHVSSPPSEDRPQVEETPQVENLSSSSRGITSEDDEEEERRLRVAPALPDLSTEEEAVE